MRRTSEQKTAVVSRASILRIETWEADCFSLLQMGRLAVLQWRSTSAILTPLLWCGCNAGCSLERLHVGKVLRSPTGQPVADQIVFGDHGSRDLSINQALDAVFPGVLEADAVDTLQGVDARGGWPI